LPAGSEVSSIIKLCIYEASKNGEPGNNPAYCLAASLWDVVTERCEAMLERVLNNRAAFIY
jgi:hypothetical protein